MEKITIYTDGSCLKNNPLGGPGGWGYIIKGDGFDIERSQGFFKTTNNRMEMMAALNAALDIERPFHLIIYTDSQYLIDGMTKWIYGWKKRNWVNIEGIPVKNKDLWLSLIDAFRMHKVTFVKVKAHTGDEYNERCDKLAKSAAANPSEDDLGFIPTHNPPKVKKPYYYRNHKKW